MKKQRLITITCSSMSNISMPISVFFSGFQASQKWMSRNRNWASLGPRERSLKNTIFLSESEDIIDFPCGFIAIDRVSRVLISRRGRKQYIKKEERGKMKRNHKEEIDGGIDWKKPIVKNGMIKTQRRRRREMGKRRRDSRLASVDLGLSQGVSRNTNQTKPISPYRKMKQNHWNKIEAQPETKCCEWVIILSNVAA